MLITQLTGGLGNQMFQYAATKAQAFRLDTDLYLDKTHFLTTPLGKKNLRQYELSHFCLDEKFKKPALHWIKKYFKVKQVYFGFETFKEKHVEVDPLFFDVKDNTYIEGVFQSEQYFKDFEAQIRADFSFKAQPISKNLELLEKIKTVNAVSLHVRRGDYVNNPETLKGHGVCGLDYYNKAIEIIAERVENPYFFLLSDDIEWVTENLKLAYPFEVINHNKGEKSYEDMRLMSNCKHHIIANSSFSWWGAWLNGNTDKIVVAPEQWFKNPNWNSKDIIPKSWVKI